MTRVLGDRGLSSINTSPVKLTKDGNSSLILVTVMFITVEVVLGLGLLPLSLAVTMRLNDGPVAS